MIIDFHTHTFPEKIAAGAINKLEKMSGLAAATDGTLDGLKASMEEAGIAISVVLPVITKPEQFASMNSYARKITPDIFTADRYGQILSFGAVHPYSPDYKEQLREIRNMGLKGIKIHPDYLGIMIDDPKMLSLIDEACCQELVISIHAGIDIGMPDKVHCPPDKSARMLDLLHPQKLVLAHMGGWNQWNMVEELLMGRDVYLDVSMSAGFMDQAQMQRLLDGHGTDRILFATDSPWGDQKSGIEYLESFRLTEDDKNKILRGNALRLLDIGLFEDKCSV